MTRRLMTCALALTCVLAAPAAFAESAYGCSGLETNRELPTIEGKGGVFFRINADLRMNHPFSPEVVDQMTALSQALEKPRHRAGLCPDPDQKRVHAGLPTGARAALWV